MDDYGPTEFISRRKMTRKILQHIERFAWSEKEGRLVLDKTGEIVFLSDVTRLIEGKE